jgi:hypothetical protein
MPRVKLTARSKILLYVLQFYLVLLLVLIVVRFLRILD